MDEAKRKRLEAGGWKVGTVEEFLGLTPEESAYIELKIALTNALKFYRQSKQTTQKQLAKFIGSSQSRVAKMEAGDPSVSVDLLVKALFALDLSADQILTHLLVEKWIFTVKTTVKKTESAVDVSTTPELPSLLIDANKPYSYVDKAFISAAA